MVAIHRSKYSIINWHKAPRGSSRITCFWQIWAQISYTLNNAQNMGLHFLTYVILFCKSDSHEWIDVSCRLCVDFLEVENENVDTLSNASSLTSPFRSFFNRKGTWGFKRKNLQKIDSLNERDRMRIKVKLFWRYPH